MASLSKSGSHATLIPVKNMDRAVKFYTETLGGKLLQRMEGEMKDFWASLQLCGCEFWLVAPEEREKRALPCTGEGKTEGCMKTNLLLTS